jgi:hypothetical protein
VLTTGREGEQDAAGQDSDRRRKAAPNRSFAHFAKSRARAPHQEHRRSPQHCGKRLRAGLKRQRDRWRGARSLTGSQRASAGRLSAYITVAFGSFIVTAIARCDSPFACSSTRRLRSPSVTLRDGPKVSRRPRSAYAQRRCISWWRCARCERRGQREHHRLASDVVAVGLDRQVVRTMSVQPARRSSSTTRYVSATPLPPR